MHPCAASLKKWLMRKKYETLKKKMCIRDSISGGFSGAAMLIERVGSLKGLTIPMQVTMILLNIPVALMCCRGISVRFTVVSLLQVVFGSIFLQIFSFQPIFTDEILNVIFGGVIYGTSIVIALRGNASTGGTDFIALYVSNKTGKSIWSYVFFGNALMYCEMCIRDRSLGMQNL